MISYKSIGANTIYSTFDANKPTTMKNIFTPEVTSGVIARINKLNPDSKPTWGKMSAAQVMAHCCVTYEMIYENHHP